MFIICFFVNWRYFFFLWFLLHFFRTFDISCCFWDVASWSSCHFFWRRVSDDCFFGWRWLLLWNDLPSSIIGLRDYILFCKAEIRIIASSSLFGQIIISTVTTIEVIVPLKPLGKLKVVLILCFRQSFNLNSHFHTSTYLLMPIFLKASWRILRFWMNS